MAPRIRKIDNAILLAIVGALLFLPEIMTKFTDWIEALIPDEWRVLGKVSMPVFGAIIGFVIGWILDRT